jgi:hypothetical protein
MRLAGAKKGAGQVAPRWLGGAFRARKATGEGTVAARAPAASRGLSEAMGRVGGRERRRPAGEAARPFVTPLFPLFIRNNMVGVTMSRPGGRQATAGTAVASMRARLDAPLARLAPLVGREARISAPGSAAFGREAGRARMVATRTAAGDWPARGPLPLGARVSAIRTDNGERVAASGADLLGSVGTAARNLARLRTVGPAFDGDGWPRSAGMAGGLRFFGERGPGGVPPGSTRWHRDGARDDGLGIGRWPVAERAVPDAPAGDAREPRHVIVMNAHDIGNATGVAVHRGLRVTAAVTPSLPSAASLPWAPGPMPALS